MATLVMVGLAPLAMQAQTPAASIPYSCNFENNTENGRWALNNPNSYVNHWVIGTSTYSSYNKSLYVSNNGTANEYSGNPSYVYAYRQINIATAGEYTVSFKWKARGETGCYDAMYAALCPPGTTCPPSNITGSTNSLPTNYINIADVSQSYNTTGAFLWTNADSDWKTSTKSVNITTTGNYYLVFYWKNDNSVQYNPPAAVDDISITAVTCSVPTLLTATAVTTNSATINWTAGDSETHWDIYYSTSNTAPTSTTTPSVSNTSTKPYTITGLTPGTTYYVWVRANCGGGDVSNWSTVVSFSTAIAAPYCEDFSTTSIPANWHQYGVLLSNVMTGTALTSGSHWSFGTSNGVFDSHARINIWGTSKYGWLVTPTIYLSGSLQLEFDLALTAYSGTLGSPATTGTDDRFVVLVSTDNMATWTILREWNNSGSSYVYNSINSTAAGESVTIDLSAYSGQSVNIAFYGQSTTSNADNNLHIDNVCINPASSCPRPTDLAVTNSGQSATVTWTAGSGSQWDVAHSTNSSADPSGNIVATGVTVPTYTMNNLSLDNDHYFWVRTRCSGSEQSSWTGPVSVHIGYCNPAPTSVDNSGITSVTFTGNNTVTNTTHPTSSPYYGNYTARVFEVQAGVEATLAITYQTGYDYSTYVWVDLNNSMSFETGEIVCSGESSSSSPTTLTLTFTIPVNQPTGNYRLRIGGADSGMDDGNSDPCYTGSYGIFEDYTLRVLEPPSCWPPSGITVTNRTDNSATINWISGGSETAWDIYWSTSSTAPTSSTEPSVSNISARPYTITGLSAGTTYYVWVRAICGVGDVSTWTYGGHFMTDLCSPENSCEITFKLTDSYGDSWNGAAIRVTDVATGIILADMANEDLNGTSGSGENEVNTLTLLVCTDREIRFSWVSGGYDSECSYVVSDANGEIFSGSSSMSSSVTYTPACINCPQPTNVTVSNITDNSAQVSWTGDAAAGSYNIRWWQPVDYATVTLTAGDVWGDFDDSGYQMLLDADANTYGTIIPTTGALTTSGDADAATYAEFEYKIPTNADGSLTTSNVVFNNSITIQVPAGTYDWCITNPTSGDRMWIASVNGNVGGRADNYVFEAGKNYEFVVSYDAPTDNDRVDLTISTVVPATCNHVEGITGSPYTITGLDPFSSYYVQVQADCDGDGESSWSPEETFVTLLPEPNVTQTDAQLPDCGNGNATLVATASLIPDGYIFHWYSNSTCTTEITTGLSGTNNNTLSYPASNAAQVWCRLERPEETSVQTFNYNGSTGSDGTIQSYTIPAGATSITLEVWGAQGGSYNDTYVGGNGGYSKGTWLSPTGGSVLYVVVGGQPSAYTTVPSSSTDTEIPGGYNGGGSAVVHYWSSNYTLPQGGGGATHIATATGLLSGLSAQQDNVLIVAGGGSGGGCYNNGSTSGYVGYAGGGATSNGYTGGTYTYTANQTTAGYGGSFGQGASYTDEYNYKYGPSGGGGGWYGGGNRQDASDTYNAELVLGHGGGSGYIKSTLTATASSNGSRSGNGQAKITAIIPAIFGAVGTVTIQCCALDAGITFPEN